MSFMDRLPALVQEWVLHQERKAKDYNSQPMPSFPEGFENADVLGIPGQFAEIWRKIWKLKRGMWDGADLVNESVREILLDLIGHCFLAIDMIDRRSSPTAEEVPESPKPFQGILHAMGLPKTQADPPKYFCEWTCNEGHTYVEGKCLLQKPGSLR